MAFIVGIRRQVFISLNLYLGQLIGGFTITWSGPILSKLRNLEESPLRHLLTETQLSLIASLLYIGCIPGPYLAGWLSNYKGRKPCLLLGGIICIIGYLILATTSNLAMLYFGRTLTGFGIGMIFVMNMVYIGEIASTSIRGILLTAMGMFTTIGSIILFSVGPYFSYSITCYVGLILSVLFTLATNLIPESPLFYLMKGNKEAVVKVLHDLGRINDKDRIYESHNEFKVTNSKRDWLELFTLKSNRKGLFIALVINIFQHSSGVMAVIFFSTTIFEMAGSSVDANISMIIISCFQLASSSITPAFIEKVGRKMLLLISTAACSVTMLSLGTYFYLRYLKLEAVNNVSWFPLVALILFFIGYESGLGIIPNCLIGEMFTTNVRSKGSAVAMTNTWLAGFLVSTAFGAVVESYGSHVAFWIFSGSSACAFLFTLFFIPETKGKSLVEIQNILAK